jgi:hypothetical protein
MATEIGRIRAILTAQASAFQKGIRSARDSVKSFDAGVKRASATVSRFARRLIGIGTAIAGGGFLVLTKRAFAAVDALAKTSDKLGVATEQLAGLHRAAELSGVATKTFDMALQRMTRRLSEAAAETGEAKDALKELRVDAVALAQMAPDQAFLEIARAMEQVHSQGDRVRLAFKLFDSEGVALVNTLRMGAKGLQDIIRETERFGTAISRVDAAQIEEVNNKFNDMRIRLDGIFQQIAVKISPLLLSVVTDFDNLGIAGKEAADKIYQAFQVVGLTIAGMFDQISALTKKVRLEGELIVAEAEVGVAAGALGPLAGLEAVTGAFGSALPGHALTQQAIKGLMSSVWTSAGQLNVFNYWKDEVGELRDEIDALATHTPATDAFVDWISRTQDLAQELRLEFEKARRARNDLAGPLPGGDILGGIRQLRFAPAVEAGTSAATIAETRGQTGQQQLRTIATTVKKIEDKMLSDDLIIEAIKQGLRALGIAHF